MIEVKQAYLVTFGFDQALRAMKVGFRVKRVEGDGRVYKIVDNYITTVGDSKPSAANTRYPVSSFYTEDILAYDWVIVLNDDETLLTGISMRPVEPWDNLEPIDKRDMGG
jgi:hypothetical protein